MGSGTKLALRLAAGLLGIALVLVAGVARAADPEAYRGVVNGKPWPTGFRPYAPTSPFNRVLPDDPKRLLPNANAVLSTMFGSKNGTWLPADFSPVGDYSHPIYAASPNDPLVFARCTQYCGPHLPAQIRVPAQARPAGGTDHHLAVIEPDGTEYDFWNAKRDESGNISASAFFTTRIDGSGVPLPNSATSGPALAAGLIRFNELLSGTIPHALFAIANCSYEVVYPGTSSSGGHPGCPPIGAHLQLDLPVAQIDALRAADWEKTILRAMHRYGVYIGDTGGVPYGFQLFWESRAQYDSYGQPYAGDAFAKSIGGIPNPWIPGGIRWSAHLRILDPCYARGTCDR